MEDSHIVCDMPTMPDHLFVAVFDGHGGSGAAIYAAANLINFIQNTSQWDQYVKEGSDNVALVGGALQQAFLDIDVALRSHQMSSPDSSGCTAVTAMITPKHIICANSGDSRCVLGTKQETRPLSEDHKPYDEGERKRIEAAGGFVQWKRVDGDLAVSRAYGDFQYKTRPDLPAKDQKVTCYPDIMVHERTELDDVLLLGCDGVWDVLSSQEGVNIVREILNSGEKDMLLVAEEVVDVALLKGSRDNISAVVVKLPGARIGDASGGGVMARRAARAEQEQLNNSTPSISK